MSGRLITALAGWKGYVAAFALGAVVAGAGAAMGVWRIRDGMEASAERDRATAAAKAARAVVASTHKAAVVTEGVTQATEARREAVRTEYRTIIERIPVYVTPEADRAVSVPVGFVRLHDAAAGGSAATLSDRAGEPADTPSGVALSAVAGTVVGNYAQCRDWREQLIGWQDWYAAQAAAWPRGSGPP